MPQFTPLGPSGGNDYFTPNFWAGRSSEAVRRRGPRTSAKVSFSIRGTCGAQSSNLILHKKVALDPPPPPPVNSCKVTTPSRIHPSDAPCTTTFSKNLNLQSSSLFPTLFCLHPTLTLSKLLYFSPLIPLYIILLQPARCLTL